VSPQARSSAPRPRSARPELWLPPFCHRPAGFGAGFAPFPSHWSPAERLQPPRSGHRRRGAERRVAGGGTGPGPRRGECWPWGNAPGPVPGSTAGISFFVVFLFFPEVCVKEKNPFKVHGFVLKQEVPRQWAGVRSTALTRSAAMPAAGGAGGDRAEPSRLHGAGSRCPGLPRTCSPVRGSEKPVPTRRQLPGR